MMGVEEAVIYGLDALALPEGSIPMEAFAIVKRLDADGREALSVRITAGFENAELATYLRVEAARLERRVSEAFAPPRPEDDA